MTLKTECPYCGKKAEITSESYLTPLKRYVWTYKCGHTQLSDVSMKSLDLGKFKSLDETKCAYEYQIDGVKFLQDNNGVGLLADAMGLGKTIQFLLWLRQNKETALPAILVLKATTMYQVAREIDTWMSKFPTCMVYSGAAIIPPGFEIYLISHDMLVDRNRGLKQRSSNLKVPIETFRTVEKLIALNPKTIVVDECHAFKDQGAKRTRALIHLIKHANPKYKILASGTPIKNKASEYFTALNILAPQHFPSEARFQREWLEQDDKGQYTRIKYWKLPQFKELTSRWIIRREKRDVMKDLPDLQRTETYVEITNPEIRAMYNSQLDLFDNAMMNGAKLNVMDILGYLAKLRHIVAVGKAQEHGIGMIREFLENTDIETKICVGIHHRNVATAFTNALADFNPLTLSGADSPEQKDWKVQQFKNPDRRLLIANILAGGVGLNLQFCSNAMVFERQWSAADERQFEDRFHRNGQTEKVVIDYVIAKGTIDEFFAKLVNRKREICNETVGDDSWSFANDEGMLKELTNEVLSNRL